MERISKSDFEYLPRGSYLYYGPLFDYNTTERKKPNHCPISDKKMIYHGKYIYTPSLEGGNGVVQWSDKDRLRIGVVIRHVGLGFEIRILV